MKLSKLFSLMKQRKRITVSQGMTAQWVGDGTALYPIYNLPQLTESTMRTLLDLTDDAWDKYTFEEHNTVHVSEEDFEEGQVQLEPARLSIRWNGVEYLPLMGGEKSTTYRRNTSSPLQMIVCSRSRSEKELSAVT